MKKRVILFALCVCMVFGLTACKSESGNQTVNNDTINTTNTTNTTNSANNDNTGNAGNTDNNIVAPDNDTPNEPEAPKGNFETVNYGSTITTDFVEMTIVEADTAQELKPTDTSGFYSYMADKDEETYFYLTGQIKNIGGDGYSVDEMNINICFDDKYNYSGFLIADDGGHDFYGDYVKPFKSVKYYIYASVPDELINQYKNCLIQFGFHDNFEHDYKSDFSVYEHCYQITVSK